MKVLVVLLALLAACNSQKNDNADIIIEGNVTGVPDGKLYLAEAKKWKTPLYSAECKNGHFVFRIKADSFFVPFPAALHYWYEGDTGKPIRLQFRNHTYGADSLQYLRDLFYLEKGQTIISGTMGTSPYLRIRAMQETELLFKNQFTDIGWMGDKDTVKRSKKMAVLKKEILQHPFSFFLLQSIYDSRQQYTEKELEELLLLFDKPIQQSAAGKKFTGYLALRPDAGMPYPNLLLQSAGGPFWHIMDTAAPLNMLVFWAGWCTPCLKEIPQLKELHRQFSSGGLNIVSISIDLNKEEWRQALQQQNMDWPQFIIAAEKIEEVQDIFRFSTIPFLVFTDDKGKELARFADYDPDNTRKYEALINQYLTRRGR
ncbi:MAG: thioredoxin-like domain-containing protein [Bacteroidota bacterium]